MIIIIITINTLLTSQNKLEVVLNIAFLTAHSAKN